MKHRLTLLAATALAVSSPALAKPAPIPSITPVAVSEKTLEEMVRTLSSDEFEGRAPSTAGEDRTVAYLIEKFKAAGLQPGNNGSWTQDVPTVEITGQNSAGLAVTGGKETLLFAPGKDFVAGSYRVTPKTDIRDAELVFVGYGINAPELGWNDYAGIDMKGKIAVILVNDPDYAQADENGLFKGRRMTWYGRWPYKFEEAARQGAAGALIVHDTFPAAYGWNVVESSWTGAQYFVAKPNDAMDQTAANGWVQLDVAKQILSAAGQDLLQLSAAAKVKGFKPVPLGLKASLKFDNQIRRSQSRNVIGVLPGKKRPDEVVLYTAHWDHLGRCKADATGDDICNGAVDNATGTAMLAALAEANVKAGPTDRSQVFLAVTLEESGLLGSEFYAQNPVFPLNKTVGGVNMDALMPGQPARDVQVTGGDKSDLTRYLKAAMGAMKLTLAPEEHIERGYYYRSDHFSLAKRGVPMFYVGRGSDWVPGGKAIADAAGGKYTKDDYHQPSDEYDGKWDWSGIVQEGELYYRLGRMLAMTTDWPNWHPTDEFREVRDKSRAMKPKPGK
ncbi:M28 family metallopeptidase [Novosphingobium sp.]|uniref:M28 family metallopeptidase n=1 Tax=Novosphingobium sp. TaxID=1874826 RepID=UPI0027351A84|nr:M28 family metallopeptidase [Novosphingobium sp.]MDP3906607.1 M28 family metallopeptidase [Novosphingobium sp.]